MISGGQAENMIRRRKPKNLPSDTYSEQAINPRIADQAKAQIFCMFITQRHRAHEELAFNNPL